MAQVAHETDLHARIDHYLAYLVEEWAAIPELASEWAGWEEHERLDFAIEWPIREDRLGLLGKWSAQGNLTVDEQVRYAELLVLIERHRPILEQLLTG